jgi:hypothetical protein
MSMQQMKYYATTLLATRALRFRRAASSSTTRRGLPGTSLKLPAGYEMGEANTTSPGDTAAARAERLIGGSLKGYDSGFASRAD